MLVFGTQVGEGRRTDAKNGQTRTIPASRMANEKENSKRENIYEMWKSIQQLATSN